MSNKVVQLAAVLVLLLHKTRSCYIRMVDTVTVLNLQAKSMSLKRLKMFVKNTKLIVTRLSCGDSPWAELVFGISVLIIQMFGRQ